MKRDIEPSRPPKLPTQGMAPECGLGVCSWSLQPRNPEDLILKLQATDIHRVQLALDPLRDDASTWANALALLQAANCTVVSGMFGCIGEDYSTLDSIRRTGGIVPDATWEQNQTNMRATAELAHRLGLHLVTFHAGFVPHDMGDPDFEKMLGRLREASRIFAAHDIRLGLETGQETAAALAMLLESLNSTDLGVNSDPANMILYDKGDPVEAVQRLGPWICQVHIKDARRTLTPGTWGEEVPVGTGEVDWRAFFSALRAMHYTGNFIIEREAGAQRIADVRTAAALWHTHNN